ncbi:MULTISPECIES: hypothetical protein [Klebsiella]|uniref:hypothetical protein n=1 Tax=Klebsiella TaxID=570 RepID=UPI0015F2ACC8|nr:MULTISPECIES: hypothetical protein [Klebsiella]MDM4467475.1 hypothetical protein [Klebsiella michiganensis]HCL7588017.1 hypothetical protein [Klebsiella oxytoca]
MSFLTLLARDGLGGPFSGTDRFDCQRPTVVIDRTTEIHCGHLTEHVLQELFLATPN